MRKKAFAVLIAAVFSLILSICASAAPLKPVADPWDDPKNLKYDGGTYYTSNPAGYVIVWETPECNVEGKYILLNNDTELKVGYRITYMDDAPWGSVSVQLEPDENGEARSFEGWILMSDLAFADGEPVIKEPVVIPEHPIIKDPEPIITPSPTPTEDVLPTIGVSEKLPQRPDQAITIVDTLNNAIVYTSAAIAVIAVAIVVIVLIKHKAVNKKGE